MEANLIGAMAFAIGVAAVLMGYWFERKHWRQTIAARQCESARSSLIRVPPREVSPATSTP